MLAGSRGAVDVFGTATGDGGKHRAVDRGFGLERLARNRRHGLAVDHVPDAFGFQFGEQGSGTVAVGLKYVLGCHLIHGCRSTFRAL